MKLTEKMKILSGNSPKHQIYMHIMPNTISMFLLNFFLFIFSFLSCRCNQIQFIYQFFPLFKHTLDTLVSHIAIDYTMLLQQHTYL